MTQPDKDSVERLAARLDDQQTKWMTPLLGEAARMLRDMHIQSIIDGALLDGTLQRVTALQARVDALETERDAAIKERDEAKRLENIAFDEWDNALKLMNDAKSLMVRANKERVEALAREGAVAMEVRDVRQWSHYPIEMPLTIDGDGPATIGVDAHYVGYEVWDRLLNSHATFDNLPDAINDAFQRSFPTTLPTDAQAALDRALDEELERAALEADRTASEARMFGDKHGEQVSKRTASCIRALKRQPGKGE